MSLTVYQRMGQGMSARGIVSFQELNKDNQMIQSEIWEAI